MRDRFIPGEGIPARIGEHMSFDMVAAPGAKRPLEYARMPDELRVEFRAGEVMSIQAMKNERFRTQAGGRLSTIFEDPDNYDSYFNSSAGGVARIVREVAGRSTLQAVVDSSISFLSANPGLCNGDTEAITRRIAEFGINEAKTIRVKSEDVPTHVQTPVDLKAQEVFEPKSQLLSSNGEPWKRTSKVGILRGPGRYKAKDRRNGRGAWSK